jgi:hypothetical protein
MLLPVFASARQLTALQEVELVVTARYRQKLPSGLTPVMLFCVYTPPVGWGGEELAGGPERKRQVSNC